MKQEPTAKEKNSVQVVERALQLLVIVSEQKQPITVGQLVEIANLNRATVWRIIGTLEQKGFVLRDHISKGYTLGMSAIKLCNRMPIHHSPLLLLSRPAMKSLWEETQESVALAIYKYSGIYTLEQIDPPHAVRLRDYTHSVTPLHCTSNGKVLLAHFSPKALNAFLSSSLEVRSKRTITDPELLRAEIMQVARQGYGTTYEELEDNENGISAPIYQGAEVVGFISVAGPAFRFTKERMEKIVPRLLEVCAEVSAQASL